MGPLRLFRGDRRSSQRSNICIAVRARTTQPEPISAGALAATWMANMPVFDQLLLVIERDWWQDAALAAGNIFFCVTLIPMLRHPGKPPLLTCIPAALGWLGGGIVFATLHLWVTALTQMIVGVQWLALALKKRVSPPPIL
jgi:hypothetical protein